MLDLLCCSICRERLQRNDHGVACGNNHRYPLVGGVPDLVPDREGARTISDTFSAQWSDFDFESDNVWGHTLDTRLQHFMEHMQATARSRTRSPNGWALASTERTSQ